MHKALCVLMMLAACGGGEEETTTTTTTSTSGSETTAVSPIPEGYHSVTAHLVVADMRAALEWYANVLGAQQTELMTAPDGSPMHGEMRIGDSVVMLGSENAEHGMRQPAALEGTCGALMVYVEDVDATFAAAIEAGATATMPVGDMFWGDRYGQVMDPYGHRWSLATHKFDAPRDQMAERGAAWGQAMAAGETPPTYTDDPPASNWQPDQMHTVTPSLVVSAPGDIDTYIAAFGAEEVSRTVTPQGTLMHAELRFGDSVVMFSQANAEMDAYMKTPSTLGGIPFNVMLYVEDADAAHAQAVSAGATSIAPVQEMFWGDRWGMVSDGAGHMWSVATHVADLSAEEIQQRMVEQFSSESAGAEETPAE